MSLADQVWSEADRRKLKEAFDKIYAEIDEGKRLIREGLDGPFTMTCQFKDVQNQVDEAEKLVDNLVLSLRQVSHMTETMRDEWESAEQTIALAVSEAYAQGWHDRLAALTQSMPEVSAAIVRWLADAFERNRRADPEKLAAVMAAFDTLWSMLNAEVPPPRYP